MNERGKTEMYDCINSSAKEKSKAIIEVLKSETNIDTILKKLAEIEPSYRYSNYYQQMELRRWFRLKNPKNPIAVTFTFSNEPKTQYIANEQYLTFIKRLSKACYGYAYKKSNKCIDHSTMSEGNESTRKHLHAVLDMPEHMSIKIFKKKIRKLWYHGSVDVALEDDGNFINYLTKLKTKDQEVFTDNLII